MESEADQIIEFRQALINFKSWVYQHKASGGLSNKENQEWAFRCLWDVEALVRGGWHSSAARQAASNLAKLERMLGVGFSKAHPSERRISLGFDNQSLGGGSREPLAKEFEDRELLRVASKLLHETARLRSEVGELKDVIISTQDANTRHPHPSAPEPKERSEGFDAMNMIDQARVAILNCEYELSAIKARIKATGEKFRE